MQQLVKQIKNPERDRLRPPRPLGENDFLVALVPQPREQARHVGGIVLAVSVHDHDRTCGQAIFDVCQPDGNRALMPQVAPQVAGRPCA